MDDSYISNSNLKFMFFNGKLDLIDTKPGLTTIKDYADIFEFKKLFLQILKNEERDMNQKTYTADELIDSLKNIV